MLLRIMGRIVETIAGSALRQSRECLEAWLGNRRQTHQVTDGRRAIAEHTRQLSGIQLMCSILRDIM